VQPKKAKETVGETRGGHYNEPSIFSYHKEYNMNFQKTSYWILILAVLVSGLSLTTPAQAQTTDPTALVIWCPAAVTPPTPKKNGCTDAFVSLNDLWSALDAAEPAQAGTIWMGKNLINGYVNGNQTFDGAQLPSMANYPLKFNGGWNGLGKGTLSPTTPTTFDGTALTVQNWIGGVTLLNLRVKNPTIAGCSVLAGVCVLTAGKIQLDRVQVVGSSLNGAYLHITSSVSSPPGPVTVTNSMFLRNGNTGLEVQTKGAVAIKNVISGQNTSFGVIIDNHLSTTASPVAITNSLFSGNRSDGLYISSDGTVTLTGAEAQDNLGKGATVSTAGNVLLKNMNTFLGNGSYGLYVSATGGVSAYQLVANENGQDGVDIDAGKAVTITHGGQFKGNSSIGLDIYAAGPITASNLTAVSNSYGLYLVTAALATTQAVTLNGVKANLNTNTGIEVITNGKVTLSCGTAYGNTTIGLYVFGASQSSAGGLKLQGFRSYLNGTDEDLSGTPVVRTACP
jgi:hypothetical protein